jgi:hypothetical protein
MEVLRRTVFEGVTRQSGVAALGDGEVYVKIEPPLVMTDGTKTGSWQEFAGDRMTRDGDSYQEPVLVTASDVVEYLGGVLVGYTVTAIDHLNA